MTQYPVFVDAGGRHVAAVVTVPDGDARGVVVSLAGTGRHNLIGSTLCTHLSQRAVEHGLVSARLDYAGVGDSPGIVPTWVLSDVTAAVQEARAVVRVALEAAGASEFVVVGTCYGSRVALELVADPACAGAVCLAPPVLQHGGLSRLGRRVGERTILARLRSQPALRRLLSPLRRALRPSKPAGGVVSAFGHLDRAPIAFLYYAEDPEQDHYNARVQEVLDAALGPLPPEHRERFEVRMLPWGPLSTFDILSPAEQDEVLDVIVPLVLGPFGEGARTRPAAVAG